MNVIQVTQYSEKILEAINELLPQLSSSAKPLTASELTEIIQSESSHLLMAEESGKFYGSLTLVTFIADKRGHR